MNVQQWLNETRASEIMSRQPVTFRPHDTLAELVEKLLERQISGGPVVSDGHCIGVISANDLVAAEEQVASDRVEFAQSGFWDGALSLPVNIYEEKLTALRARISPLAQQPVERFMTTDVVSVVESDSLANVVQKIIDAHVHRVVVLNEQQKLVGLISTIDVLARLLPVSRIDEQTAN